MCCPLSDDFGTDTTVREDLEENGMLQATIDDMRLLNTFS